MLMRLPIRTVSLVAARRAALAPGAARLARLHAPALAARPLALTRRAAFTTFAEADKVVKSETEWKSSLTDMEYYVLREKGTERPGTGEYDKFYPEAGHFVCAGCGNPLYSAQSKFSSGCGWPAFDKCYKGGVDTTIDQSFGMRRIEITCAKCDGHLGHVFEGEMMTPTNERHCVNSISVKYVEGEPAAVLEEAKVSPPRTGLGSEGGINIMSSASALLAAGLLVYLLVKLLFS